MARARTYTRKQRGSLFAILAGVAFSIPALFAYDAYARQVAIGKLQVLAGDLARQALYMPAEEGEVSLPCPGMVQGTAGRITGLKPTIRQRIDDTTLVAEATLEGTWEPAFGMFPSAYARPIAVSARMMIVN